MLASVATLVLCGGLHQPTLILLGCKIQSRSPAFSNHLLNLQALLLSVARPVVAWDNIQTFHLGLVVKVMATESLVQLIRCTVLCPSSIPLVKEFLMALLD
jgi:hypothetical protein